MPLNLFLGTVLAAGLIGYAALALPRLASFWPVIIGVLGIAGVIWAWTAAPEVSGGGQIFNDAANGLTTLVQLGAIAVGLVGGWKAADWMH